MIDGVPINALGPVALAGIAVILILTGRLIPRRTHDAIVSSKDREIEHWREAAKERSSQLTQLLAATDTSTRAIEALTEVAGIRRREGAP